MQRISLYQNENSSHFALINIFFYEFLLTFKICNLIVIRIKFQKNIDVTNIIILK